MCTFENDGRTAAVCDVALPYVRAAVARDLDSAGAEFVHREGQATLVHLASDGDARRFRAAVEEGIRRAAEEDARSAR